MPAVDADGEHSDERGDTQHYSGQSPALGGKADPDAQEYHCEEAIQEVHCGTEVLPHTDDDRTLAALPVLSVVPVVIADEYIILPDPYADRHKEEVERWGASDGSVGGEDRRHPVEEYHCHVSQPVGGEWVGPVGVGVDTHQHQQSYGDEPPCPGEQHCCEAGEDGDPGGDQHSGQHLSRGHFTGHQHSAKSDSLVGVFLPLVVEVIVGKVAGDLR